MIKLYKKERPVILSIVAILEMITGASVILMGGLFLIISLGLLGEDFSSVLESTFAASFSAVFGLLAVGIFFVGFLIFILGYGLWNLNVAAWFVSTILYGLSSISIALSYETLLIYIQTGNYSNLVTPVITVGLFIYFLTIKDKFH